MATIVLIHSALGLTRHVHDWAEAFREDGHTVVTPDLFGGRTFDNLDDAMVLVDGEGLGHWVSVARDAVAGIEGPTIYAGFSLGGAVGEVLALTDPDAVGLAVLHGALSPHWFELTAWPAGLEAQLHYAADDPWVEDDENAAFLALAGDHCETFVYEGDGHLFGFEGWHEYDAEASHLMFERLGDFFATFD